MLNVELALIIGNSGLKTGAIIKLTVTEYKMRFTIQKWMEYIHLESCMLQKLFNSNVNDIKGYMTYILV